MSSCTRSSARTYAPAIRLARERSQRRSPRPAAPVFGVRVLRDIPLGEVLDLLDLDELFRLAVGRARFGTAIRGRSACATSSSPRSRGCNRSAARRLARAAGVYGYFPAQSQGNAMIVYDPGGYRSDGGSLRRESARFQFPGRKTASDSVSPTISAQWSLETSTSRPLQIVTVGDAATRRFDTLQASDQYSRSVLRHGVAVEAAEATAEWMHRRIRRELGIPPAREALLVGLRRLPRSRRSHAGLQAAACRVRVRHAADERLPVGAGAVHRRDHRASSSGASTTPCASWVTEGAESCAPASPRRGGMKRVERLLDPELVVVFDGAMGTMLYHKGVFINQCYDELVLAGAEARA